MGEYEPDDSRIVTNVAAEAPGEPPRTGPREDQARAMARRDESEELEEKGKPTARDAAGEKQQGYKSDEKDDDDEEEPPLGK
jgi:hypothetical protein